MKNKLFSRIFNWLKSTVYRSHSQTSRITGLFSILLVVCLLVSGCSLPSSRTLLLGDYQYDTQYVIDSFSEVIDIPTEESGQVLAQEEADALINEYISRYRRDPKLAESGSFMATKSALSGLAGFYHPYPNRPLPQDLKDRIKQQFKQANIALKREFE